jgi:hypothetical protein
MSRRPGAIPHDAWYCRYCKTYRPPSSFLQVSRRESALCDHCIDAMLDELHVDRPATMGQKARNVCHDETNCHDPGFVVLYVLDTLYRRAASPKARCAHTYGDDTAAGQVRPPCIGREDTLHASVGRPPCPRRPPGRCRCGSEQCRVVHPAEEGSVEGRRR